MLSPQTGDRVSNQPPEPLTADLVFTDLTAQNSATIPVCLAEMDYSGRQLAHDWEFATHRITSSLAHFPLRMGS